MGKIKFLLLLVFICLSNILNAQGWKDASETHTISKKASNGKTYSMQYTIKHYTYFTGKFDSYGHELSNEDKYTVSLSGGLNGGLIMAAIKFSASAGGGCPCGKNIFTLNWKNGNASMGTEYILMSCGLPCPNMTWSAELFFWDEI